jgi:hypothetical protein
VIRRISTCPAGGASIPATCRRTDGRPKLNRALSPSAANPIAGVFPKRANIFLSTASPVGLVLQHRRLSPEVEEDASLRVGDSERADEIVDPDDAVDAVSRLKRRVFASKRRDADPGRRRKTSVSPDVESEHSSDRKPVVRAEALDAGRRARDAAPGLDAGMM